MTEGKKCFQQLNHHIQQRWYALLPKRKMRNAQYCFVAYQNQYPVVCITSVSQKKTLQFQFSHKVTPIHQLLQHLHLNFREFPFVLLKSHSQSQSWFSNIKRKQLRKSQSQTTQRINEYMYTYLYAPPKEILSLGFLVYNPGKENLVH